MQSGEDHLAMQHACKFPSSIRAEQQTYRTCNTKSTCWNLLALLLIVHKHAPSLWLYTSTHCIPLVVHDQLTCGEPNADGDWRGLQHRPDIRYNCGFHHRERNYSVGQTRESLQNQKQRNRARVVENEASGTHQLEDRGYPFDKE